MNTTDLVLIVLGGYFIVRGLFRGLSGELLSLISVIGGFYCALTFYVRMAKILSRALELPPLVATPLAMTGIFVLVYVATSVVERFARKLLRATRLTWMDKLAGGVAGFIKSYLIALLLLVGGMILAPVTGDAWVKESEALRITAKTWPFIYPLLDRMGVLPNVESLQEEAASYIQKQAMSETKLAKSKPLPARSDDLPSQDSPVGRDAPEKWGDPKNSMLDTLNHFFPSFGKKDESGDVRKSYF